MKLDSNFIIDALLMIKGVYNSISGPEKVLGTNLGLASKAALL